MKAQVPEQNHLFRHSECPSAFPSPQTYTRHKLRHVTPIVIATCMLAMSAVASATDVTTYHNDIWGNVSGGSWHGANTLSKCIVSANGVPSMARNASLSATSSAGGSA